MSDTPKTDAFAAAYLGGPAQTARYRRDYEWRRFARVLEIEAAAWKQAFKDHCTNFYSMKALAGDIPAAQVSILTNIAVNDYAAQIAAFEFDCYHDGDWKKCDKEMCQREQQCRRRT